MMFCPKCGSLLKPMVDKNKTVLACGCGYIQKKPEVNTLKEKVIKDTVEVAIISENDETLPITKVECPKCHHMKAQFWTQQIRAADEPETKFMKCVKCKHLWRDNS